MNGKSLSWRSLLRHHRHHYRRTMRIKLALMDHILPGHPLDRLSFVYLQIFKMLPWWCMMQLKSIVSGHKSVNISMSKKLKEVQLEKNALSNQLYNHQKHIDELKSDLENSKQITAEQNLHHNMEKDELLSQILYLQKEVSQLSSALSREKEILKKDLEKSKSKLKDTKSKLKNAFQEKVKLEGEKAQAEREIKILQGQRPILERDILKHDSHFDKKRESRSDFNKVAQNNLQDDYEKLEFMSFEMEAEISSLKEALKIMICEKEEASAKNDYLNYELEAMENKLNPANLEMELLKEELARMDQKVADSESFSRGLKESLDLLSKEKEEMIMELIEALLEVEAEKLGWTSKERNFIEKLKSSNKEIVELSENLSEDAYHRNKELRKKLSSTQAKLDAYRIRFKEASNEKQVMDRKYQEASTKLKSQLRTYGQHILELTKKLAEKSVA